MTTGKNSTGYQKGDLVLVLFPFTDLSANKTRPALVLSVPSYGQATGNLLLAMVTSAFHDSPYDCEIKDWKAANLLGPSWVRIKLATLDPELVRYKPGKLSQADLAEVQKKLKAAFGF